MTEAKKWSPWSGKIETAQQAREVVRDAAIAFYVVAGIQALAALLLGLSTLLDSAIYALLALWLHKARSQVAGLLLLAFSILSVVMTLASLLGASGGGRNVVLSLMVLWGAIRAVQATSKLPELERAERATIEPA